MNPRAAHASARSRTGRLAVATGDRAEELPVPSLSMAGGLMFPAGPGSMAVLRTANVSPRSGCPTKKVPHFAVTLWPEGRCLAR